MTLEEVEERVMELDWVKIECKELRPRDDHHCVQPFSSV